MGATMENFRCSTLFLLIQVSPILTYTSPLVTRNTSTGCQVLAWPRLKKHKLEQASKLILVTVLHSAEYWPLTFWISVYPTGWYLFQKVSFLVDNKGYPCESPMLCRSEIDKENQRIDTQFTALRGKSSLNIIFGFYFFYTSEGDTFSDLWFSEDPGP